VKTALLKARYHVRRHFGDTNAVKQRRQLLGDISIAGTDIK
jgi:hypothetical protein